MFGGVDISARVTCMDNFDRGVLDGDPESLNAGDDLFMDWPFVADPWIVGEKADDLACDACAASISRAFIE